MNPPVKTERIRVYETRMRSRYATAIRSTAG